MINNLQIILISFFFLGLLVLLFYNYLYVGRQQMRVKLIEDNKIITQTYQETIPLNKLFDINSRKSITIPGNPNGDGLTFIWNMNMPNFTSERMWFTSYSKDKPIIRLGDSPHIVYNPRDNSLKVIVKFKYTQFDHHYPIIELKDIPLQRWNKFIVVVDTNSVKIYINGSIKIHKILKNPIIISNEDLVLGDVNNNIIGEIADMELVFIPLNNVEVNKEF